MRKKWLLLIPAIFTLLSFTNDGNGPCDVGYEWNGYDCIDIDECTYPESCPPDYMCRNILGGYICENLDGDILINGGGSGNNAIYVIKTSDCKVKEQVQFDGTINFFGKRIKISSVGIGLVYEKEWISAVVNCSSGGNSLCKPISCLDIVIAANK